jgi:prepilin-type N-terminal cleavage/methylation domain-containing protein
MIGRNQRTVSAPGFRMPPGRTLRDGSAGFTLIEVLIVIAIIVTLVVGGGLAIGGRGGDGAALANAQNLVTSLVGATRAQAALHQTAARLIVNGQQPPAANSTTYLRSLQIVRQDTSNNAIWVAVGDPVTLPIPICVVPPSPVPTNHLNTGVAWNNNAATGPVSTLTVLTGFSYRGQLNATTNQFFGTQSQSGRILYLEFASDGTVSSNTSGNPTKIALTTAELRPNAFPLFNNAGSVRGLFVRRSGSISLVDLATGF